MGEQKRHEWTGSDGRRCFAQVDEDGDAQCSFRHPEVAIELCRLASEVATLKDELALLKLNSLTLAKAGETMPNEAPREVWIDLSEAVDRIDEGDTVIPAFTEDLSGMQKFIRADLADHPAPSARERRIAEIANRVAVARITPDQLGWECPGCLAKSALRPDGGTIDEQCAQNCAVAAIEEIQDLLSAPETPAAPAKAWVEMSPCPNAEKSGRVGLCMVRLVVGEQRGLFSLAALTEESARKQADEWASTLGIEVRTEAVG